MDKKDENVQNHEQATLKNKSADKKETKKLSKKKITLIVVSVTACLFIAIASTIIGVFLHYYSLMDISNDDDIVYSDDVSFTDEEKAEIPEGDVELPENNLYSDKSVLNILLIGTDERTSEFNVNARADSIMVLSLNKKEQTVKLVSLERGMLVQIPGRKNDILTHTFRYGGANLLINTVQTHFNLDVDKYVRINLSMFEKLIDEVGGVDVTLTAEEAYGLNTYPNGNTWKIDRVIPAGENHLNGYEALQYSRLRWIDSDWQRIERQRRVINAIKNSMSGMSIGELSDLSEKCLPYVQTNLTSLEFADLLISLPNYFNSDLEQMTIPKKGTYQGLGQVDFEANSKILREFFYGE